jgi:hypothetical protein
MLGFVFGLAFAPIMRLRVTLSSSILMQYDHENERDRSAMCNKLMRVKGDWFVFIGYPQQSCVGSAHVLRITPCLKREH